VARSPTRSRRIALRVGCWTAVLVVAACEGDDGPTELTFPPEPPTEPPPVDTVTPVYQVTPPEGKVPWPQHDPDWSQGEYDQMLADLWIVNNFALYQGSEARTSLYLHDGLDVVLPNGTPVFAVAAGTVRANLGADPYYRTLVVEDADSPGYAWGYTHVNSLQVAPGQAVHLGTRLAHVLFSGLEHVHLDRLRLRAGGDWSTWTDLIHLQPDTFFVYTDTEPPVFLGPLRFLRDGTDDPFPSVPGEPLVVSGDVDIVAGLRDPGEWARSKEPFGGPDTYGDRNSPNRIAYQIATIDGGLVQEGLSLDFSTWALSREVPSERVEQVLSIYQHYESVVPPAPPVGNWNRKFNFYIVTNTGGMAEAGLFDHATRGGAWHTAALDGSGERLFPNGPYVVTVRAWDFKGNLAALADTVVVAN